MSTDTIVCKLIDSDGRELLTEALPGNVADYATNTIAGAVKRIRENASYLASQTPSPAAGAVPPTADPPDAGKLASEGRCDSGAASTPYPEWFSDDIVANWRANDDAPEGIDLMSITLTVGLGGFGFVVGELAGRTGSIEYVAAFLRHAIDRLRDCLTPATDVADNWVDSTFLDGFTPSLPTVPPRRFDAPKVADPEGGAS